MRVKSISIRKLFGRLDYTIPLNQSERITIVHGPNGYGKTALLRLVNAMVHRDFDVLRATPFESLRLDFQDGTYLALRRGRSEEEDERSYLLTYSLGQGQDEEAEWTILVYGWRHGSETLLGAGPIRAAIEKFLTRCPVHLVTVQRLLVPSGEPRTSSSDGSESFQPAVSVYSEVFLAAVRYTQARYTQKAQHLDRSFPQRVMQEPETGIPSDGALKQTLAELEAKRSHLAALGILPGDDAEFEIPSGEFDDATRKLLWVYARDVEDKLSVFDELAAKVDLLQTIINKRFQFKRLVIDMERGFSFESDDGQALPPTALSSGEQHELVMLYECLFELPPNALVLLDEPELSLHVSWQIEFLRDLQKVVELAGIDVLMATHSPQIIHDRWDLTIDLQELFRTSQDQLQSPAISTEAASPAE